MAKVLPLLPISYTFLLVLLTSLICARADEERKVYIVYMGSIPKNKLYTPSSHHVSLLQKITGPSFSEKLMVRSYEKSFNGFVAKLTRDEAHKLSGEESVVSVIRERNYTLQTTRSWDFLGFSETESRIPQFESDTIIGVIDTGIWPELASFSDEGFGPPPYKWNGVCHGGRGFFCNNKVIGARYYGNLHTARDYDGHGTHASSIAAGVSVKDTSFYGLAHGTVRGGAPSARIAVYTVCFSYDCTNIDILDAFYDAIQDGVDIISISLAEQIPLPLDEDVISIGSFHAMDAGIFTSQCAGNYGNTIGITSNAPWLITVAASSIDRRIIDKVVLGNGKILVGSSIQTLDLNGAMYPLVSSHRHDLTGKIIAEIDTGPLDAASDDAFGAIYISPQNDNPQVEPIPAASLSRSDFELVSSYINSSRAPVATITRSEELRDRSAPVVVSFSSRGPNSFLPEIMKPDVTAPGVGILAGYSPEAHITQYQFDNRRVAYNIMSGTSMACPHITGIAAYIKSLYPDWHPSAIQSAIMTTATPLNPTTNPEGEFAYGSGQVDPIKASDPGLVYEALKEDYIKLLCRNGYDDDKLRAITLDDSTCPTDIDETIFDFNYPSLTAKVNPHTPFTLKFQRTLTNVGPDNSIYYPRNISSPDFEVILEPTALFFHSHNQKISFSVTITGQGFPDNSFRSSALEWSDGRDHKVRTPIVVHTITPRLPNDVDSY